MSLFTRQTLVRVVDPEISQLAGKTGKTSEQSNAQFIVITHPAMSLTTIPQISVGDTEITLGAVGSGAEYEYKRISATQTLVIKNTFATPITNQGTFDPTVTYNLNDRVLTYTGIWYSQIAENIGNVPETSPLDWASTPYVPDTISVVDNHGSWDATHVYAQNDSVTYYGATWYAQKSNTSSVPKAGNPDWSSVAINTSAPVMMLGLPSGSLPIGEAVIGSTFVIG